MEFTLALNHRKTFSAIQGVLLSFLLFFAFTRGFFQLLLPKPITMMAQVLGVSGVCFYFLVKSPLKLDIKTKPVLLLVLSFAVVVSLSAIWTILTMNSIKWFVYFFFTLFFLLQFLFSMSLFLNEIRVPSLPKILLFWGWTLFLVSIIEMFKLIKLPGSSELWFLRRPASLTGSMLHYPIIMALLGGIFLSFYQRTKEKVHLWSGCIFSLIPFTVLSRSGIFIVGSFFLFCFLQLPLVNMRKFLRIILVFLGVFAICTLMYGGINTSSESDEESLPSLMFTRITSAVNKSAKGNNTRLITWSRVTKEWQNTNLIFGEKMGEYTNSTAFLNREGRGRISESSILQQLMNFGFVGAFTFYILLLLPLWIMKRSSYMFRGIYLAGLLQTLFVQSIEVVSYMSLLLMIPWIGQENSISKDS
ncbi:hypothetical protein AB751O23_AO_00100 [Chlamydiales bacterium SCGC AB-751-O23]|jgi:hypothetical protein|nr:hypothetical protein AB751O23_AO_00100 [Chlamydiales bacterium SCGC AB-751-O23]